MGWTMAGYLLRVLAPYLIGAAVISAVIAGHVLMVNRAVAANTQALTDKHSAVVAGWRAALEQERADGEKRERDKERQRENDLRKVADDAQKQIDQARRDAAASAGLADSLRKQADALAIAIRAASGHSATAGAGKAAGAAGMVFADVFSSADARAAEVAASLDRSHAAGIACERAYEVNRKGQP